MNNDSAVSEIPGIYPVTGKVEAKWSWGKKIFKIETDSDVYPLCTQKITHFGVKKRRHLHIQCDGKGKMNYKELLGTDERMKRLQEWKDKGWITQEHFEKKREKILKDL